MTKSIYHYSVIIRWANSWPYWASLNETRRYMVLFSSFRYLSEEEIFETILPIICLEEENGGKCIHSAALITSLQTDENIAKQHYNQV